MHRSKLFRALVIGGGMTAASLVGCGDEATNSAPASDEQSQSAGDETSNTDDNTSDETSSDSNETAGGDSSQPGDETDTDTDNGTDTDTDTDNETDPETDPTDEEATPTDAEPVVCFCGDEPQCCEEVDGEAQVAEGFECCWGTSC
jgi:hypothetical protein